MAAKTTCIVTGGSGFVGRRMVRELVATDKYAVRVFDLNPPPESDAFSSDVVFIQGDLTNVEDVNNALTGVRICFHVATAAPTAENTLSDDLMRRVNVDGTKNVIDACVRYGVEKLIYTSTASVAFDGSDILYKNEEQLGYASYPLDHYTVTKTIAEQMVLAANGRGGTLATCALRPSAIFGEGDGLLVPSLVKNAKKGKTKYMIGDGENLMEFTYVGNVVQAHLLAADKLSLESPTAGQAFFITNQEPRKFWQFTGDLLEGLGYERPRIRLPFWLMFVVFFIFQYLISPLLKPFIKISSDLTVNRVRIVARNRVFNTKKSVEILGYVPKVTMSEATERTIEHFKYLRRKP